MKKILLLFTIALLTINLSAQQGEWTWMKGDSTSNLTGVYGTQGVFDPANTPPGLYEACEWTDLNGNFWLFGGSNYCDLWEFKPAINQWAWIKGPGIAGQFGIYGIQNIPSPTNNPGSRGWGMLSWVDISGNLWMFGGVGNAVSNNGFLNDLWMYDIVVNEWTWMAGTDTINDLGSYGTIMVSSPTNDPPSRSETSASWTDSSNNSLWLFGGQHNGKYSDLWKFDISTNQWTWMKGPNTTNQPSVYGTIGVPDATNVPCGRMCYAKWKDSNSNFWLFGGNDGVHNLNDLWRYNPATNNWTWMSGTNALNDSGNYGVKCIPSINNVPFSRYENRACWTRNCDNFVSFGCSSQINDLWNYNTNTNEWTWMSGDSVTNSTGNYGTILVSSPSNMPAGRPGCVGWKDTLGNLWMFGGLYTLFGLRNDLWRYVPDTTCPVLAIPSVVTSLFYAQPTSGCSPLTVIFTNTSINGFSYSWNFGDTSYSNAMNPTHIFTHGGTYIVKLVAYGSCGSHSDTATQTITIIPSPTPIITGDSSICSGNSSVLDAGSFPLYVWSTGASSQTISVDTTGTFSVTVTCSNGCTSTALRTVTVHQNPTPIITGDSLTCSINPSLLDAGSYAQYQWSTGSTTETISVNTTNNYIVTVTDSYGCTGTASLWITVNVTPTASFTVDTTMGCSPITILFNNNSSNATGYLWDLGNSNASTATNPSITYTTSGTYTITLIAYGAGGCNDTLIMNNYITINTIPTVTCSFIADTLSGCNPLTVSFTNTSTNGTSYLWNFGDNLTATTLNATHIYNDSGTFTITLIATNNSPCGIVRDTFIKQSLIRVDDPISITSNITATPLSGCAPLIVTFTQTNTNGAPYHWYFGDGGHDSINNPIHTYYPGTYLIYLLVYNNTNLCKYLQDSASIAITADNCELFIPNIFSPNGDGKNDYFNLIAEGYTNYHLLIFNRWGELLFESFQNYLLWDGYDSSGTKVPDGTYYYIFTANDINGNSYSNKGFLTLLR